MPTEPRVILDKDTLYSCDNGAVYCGEHCGASARYSGRDISGQEVMVLTKQDVANARAAYGVTLRCETCRKEATK